MPAIVEVSDLVFEYPGVRALDGVSFSVERGSVTALVGPNGAGKSTLLRCMAALETPLDGRIVVAGVDVIEEPRACHRHIGYLSDFFGLYDGLSVRRCLTHAALSQGLDPAPAAAAAEEVAARLGIAPKLDANAGELSRGQRQRLAIGQALVQSPALLILDEPASGLDPEARHGLAELFGQLRARGMTLIVSSHILAELDEYSTHMLVMRGGRIVESRALHPMGGNGGSPVVLRAEFAAPVSREAILAALKGMPGASLIQHDGQGARLGLAEGPALQAALLGALVQAGLPLLEFARERESLHQSYLRTVRAADPGLPPGSTRP